MTWRLFAKRAFAGVLPIYLAKIAIRRLVGLEPNLLLALSAPRLFNKQSYYYSLKVILNNKE